MLNILFESTTAIKNKLGTLYENQDRMAEAEMMYQLAQKGKEKVQSTRSTSTPSTAKALESSEPDDEDEKAC